MYVPEPFSVSDRELVLDLIDEHPFATVVTFDAARPLVSHVPITLTRDASAWGTLRGHVARANSHWRHFDGEWESLVIFHGPHAYVSPSAYADKAAPPTWNYAVVHAYGRPGRIEDPARAAALLDELVTRFDANPSSLALTAQRRRALQKGIVAFEFEIERVESKFKLGQNKTPADRVGTVAALEDRGSDAEMALAAWTRRITGDG